MRRRTLLTSAGMAAALLSTAGCGLSGGKGEDGPSVLSTEKLSGTITFQTWSLKNERFTPYFEKLIKDFQTKNPGTTIKWLDQPGDGYEEKILQQANSNTLPDVVNLPPDFAYQLAKAGALADVRTLTPKADEIYVKGGLDAYTFEGVKGTFGYPWYLGTDMYFFNTKALKDAGVKQPTSWDEMITTAKTMAKNTGGKTPLISALPGLDTFKANGVAPMKDGKFAFNDPKAAAILDQYKDLYKAKAMPPEALKNNDGAPLYLQGKVAWSTGTSSFIADMKREAPNLLPLSNITPRFTPAPLFVQGISVAKGSKNLALAKAFAEFVSNNANQVAFVKIAQGFMPGTAEANAHPESFAGSLDDKDMAKAVKIAASQMDKAEVPAPVQYTNDMSTYTNQQMALAVRGDITSQEALDKAVAYCNRKLI